MSLIRYRLFLFFPSLWQMTWLYSQTKRNQRRLNSHDLLFIYPQIRDTKSNQCSIFLKCIYLYILRRHNLHFCPWDCAGWPKHLPAQVCNRSVLSECWAFNSFSHRKIGCTATGQTRTQAVGETDFPGDAAGDSGEFN